jgi:hypothetical protein
MIVGRRVNIFANQPHLLHVASRSIAHHHDVFGWSIGHTWVVGQHVKLGPQAYFFIHFVPIFK